MIELQNKAMAPSLRNAPVLSLMPAGRAEKPLLLLIAWLLPIAPDSADVFQPELKTLLPSTDHSGELHGEGTDSHRIT
jgi:hypothetical protein